MLSIETESRIAKVFLVLASKEREVELQRQVLAQQVEFNVHQTFCYLDKERKNTVCAVNVLDFLRRNGVYAHANEVRLLIQFYDADKDALLAYNEFADMVLSESNCMLRKLAGERGGMCCTKALNYNVETALVRVFEKELELIRSIMQLVADVKKRFDFNVDNIFHMVTGCDTITHESVKHFLSKNEVVFTEEDVKAVIKRLDINKDKHVDIWEFSAFLLFPENYKCCCIAHNCCLRSICGMANRVECKYVTNEYSKEEARKRTSNLALRMSPQRKYSPRSPLSPLRCGTSHSTTQPNTSISMSTNNNCTAINDKSRSSNAHTSIHTYIPYETNTNWFLSYIKDVMTFETQIEHAKIELAMYNEFNVEDAFRIFELDGRGFVNVADLKYGLSLLGIYATPNDVKLLMRRVDLKHKGHLSFGDFFDLVTPFEKDYRSMIENRATCERVLLQCGKENAFGIRTKICLQNLLRLIINAESELEHRRMEIVNDVTNVAKEAFRKMDRNGLGKVNDQEMNEYLQRNGVFCSERENGLVFIRFDRNRDGKVELWELIEEFKV